MTQVNVLVLMWHSQNERSIKNLPESVSKQYKFFYQQTAKYDPRTSKFNLLDFVEDAKTLITKHNITVVLSLAVDYATIVSAALAKEMPEIHFRTPSIESIFLCHDKYYTRCFVDPHPIPFTVVGLSQAQRDLSSVCDDVMQKVPFPAFLKPTSGTRSEGVANIPTKEDLALKLQEFFTKYAKTSHSTVKHAVTDQVSAFYSKYIDVERYPLCLQPAVLIEKHMGTIPIVNADGYVFNGRITHWSLSENIYHKSKPQCFLGVAHPCLISDVLSAKVWIYYDEVVSKVIEYGFDNQFINVEMFICDDGELKIMEINPRMAIYHTVFCNDVFDRTATETVLKLAQGIDPGIPIPSGRHALFGYVNTTGCGKAKEFLDFESDNTIDPLLTPDDYIDGSGDSGGILARMAVVGDSRDDVMKKWKAICRRVLLKPELTVWY